MQREVTRRNGRKAIHDAEGGPTSLGNWGAWYGTHAARLSESFIESAVGGSIADTTRKLYSGQFAQWERLRRVNNLTPYLTGFPDGAPEDEESALSYIALSVGPLGKYINAVL